MQNRVIATFLVLEVETHDTSYGIRDANKALIFENSPQPDIRTAFGSYAS